MIKWILTQLFGKKPRIVHSFGEISSFELKKLIPIKKTGSSNVVYLGFPNIYLTDNKYKLPHINQIKEFLKKDKTDWQKYVKETNDCDNFAIQLAGKLNAEFPGFAVGYAQSDKHAFNIFIDNTKTVYLIEPQTDKILKPDKDRYEIRMVLI